MAYDQSLMAELRQAIGEGELASFVARFKADQAAGDLPTL